MIKVLADKTFRFTNGLRDAKGHLISYTTKIGFCDLPDWVEGTDLYRDAVKENSLHPVTAGVKSEDTQKFSEEIADLKHQIEVLQQEKELRKLKLDVNEEENAKKEAVDNEEIQERVKRAYNRKAPK